MQRHKSLRLEMYGGKTCFARLSFTEAVNFSRALDYQIHEVNGLCTKYNLYYLQAISLAIRFLPITLDCSSESCYPLKTEAYPAFPYR